MMFTVIKTRAELKDLIYANVKSLVTKPCTIDVQLVHDARNMQINVAFVVSYPDGHMLTLCDWKEDKMNMVQTQLTQECYLAFNVENDRINTKEWRDDLRVASRQVAQRINAGCI